MEMHSNILPERIWEGKEMVSDAKKRANIKYDYTHTRQIKFKFNLETDKDILKKLDGVGNKQGYVKKLIRDDIKKEAGD